MLGNLIVFAHYVDLAWPCCFLLAGPVARKGLFVWQTTMRKDGKPLGASGEERERNRVVNTAERWSEKKAGEERREKQYYSMRVMQKPRQGEVTLKDDAVVKRGFLFE